MEKGSSKSKGVYGSSSMDDVSPNGTGIRVDGGHSYDVHRFLDMFWSYQTDKIEKMSPAEFRETKISQELPLARIKKIMKLDDDVKTQMISAEAPVLFAKACEMFIEELTVRAWVHTEDNKRKTLQKNDIALAISKHDQFDFLIDIVPREEIVKGSGAGVSNSPGSSKGLPSSTATAHVDSNLPMFVQMAAPATPGIMTQPAVQTIQLQNGQILQAQTLGGQQLQLVQGANGELQLVNVNTSTHSQPQSAQIVSQPQQRHQDTSSGQASSSPFAQAFQQIVAPDGTVHHLPIQLSPAQLNYLKQHLSGGGGSGGQQQVHIIQTASTSTTNIGNANTVSRAPSQQPSAFFIQTPGPVGQTQQQDQQQSSSGIQLQLISAEHQESLATVTTSN